LLEFRGGTEYAGLIEIAQAFCVDGVATASNLQGKKLVLYTDEGSDYNENIRYDNDGAHIKYSLVVSPPIVETMAVKNITENSATSGGNVAADGGTAVTARGICWSTSAIPTTSDNTTSDGTGAGEFTSSLKGLSPGTTYHARAYATNSVGTGYGRNVSFTTYGTTFYVCSDGVCGGKPNLPFLLFEYTKSRKLIYNRGLDQLQNSAVCLQNWAIFGVYFPGGEPVLEA
jgi:hypothetical protein